MVVNEILLRRKQSIILDERDSWIIDNRNYNRPNPETKPYLAAFLENLATFGYTLSNQLIQLLECSNKETIVELYKELTGAISKLKGSFADEFLVMYPNFPRQVAEADDVELLINAFVHYLSYGTVFPDYQKETRFPLIFDRKFEVINAVSWDSLNEIFDNLLASPTNLSEQDKKDISWFIENNDNTYYIGKIPNKENLAFYCATVFDNNKNEFPCNRLISYIKAPTDLLRMITASSDGDVSLATNTKFLKLNRGYRRFIMKVLNSFEESCLEDMFLYREKWLRIGEILHPGEFIKKNPNQYIRVEYFFEKLRNNDKPLFWRGQVEKAISENDTETLLPLLIQRPGEFARKLDQVLRTFYYNVDVFIKEFETVADKVASPVLWQLISHFETRNDDDYRIFFPKGMTAKMYVIPNGLNEDDIKKEVIEKIIITCKNALFKTYKNRNRLGKVFVDESLKNYIVPFSQRSANSSSKILTRGSKIPIHDNTKIIRPFIWWTNTSKKNIDRVDLDLSVGFYNDNFELISHVSYTNLRDGNLKVYHSGDITNGGDPKGRGVAEFIDFDLEQLSKVGRYAVIQVYSYTQQRFKDLPNCAFGWMDREDFDSGEIFEPKTVQNLIDIRCAGTYCIPCIIDAKDRCIIWCDVAFQQGKTYRGGNNLESNVRNTNFLLYAMTHLHKPNLYDLCLMNAISRGNLVWYREEADVIYSDDKTKPVIINRFYDEESGTVRETETEKDVQICTPYDLDVIVGTLL